MRIRRARRRRALWLPAIALAAAGSAYLASNNVPPSSAGDTSLTAHVYTYDDASPTISYAGTWAHTGPSAQTTGDYNGTISSSQEKGASASVSFTGTTVQWIGEKGPTGGTAEVYLTTVPVATVDEYAATPEDQQLVFSKTVTSGAHTLKIEVTGPTVYIDAINVQ